MNNKLKESWTRLVYIQNLKQKIEPSINNVEFDILCLVSLKPTSRAKIMRHRYFSNVSLSTIKRAVNMLISYGLVEITLCADGREKMITVVAL
jgi:predicted transcriptional regulator